MFCIRKDAIRSGEAVGAFCLGADHAALLCHYALITFSMPAILIGAAVRISSRDFVVALTACPDVLAEGALGEVVAFISFVDKSRDF